MNQDTLIKMVKFVARRRNLPTKPDFPLNINNVGTYIKGKFGGVSISIFADSRKVVIGDKSYVLTTTQFDSLCN